MFTGAAQPVELELSEINYHSDPTLDASDWVEIHNVADYPIDLTQYKVQDRDWFNAYPIPAGTILMPDERLVVVEDDAKFASAYPEYSTKLEALYSVMTTVETRCACDPTGRESTVLQSTYESPTRLHGPAHLMALAVRWKGRVA